MEQSAINKLCRFKNSNRIDKTVSSAYLMGITDGRRNLKLIMQSGTNVPLAVTISNELAMCDRLKRCAYSGTPANAEYLRGLSDFWANQARKPY